MKSLVVLMSDFGLDSGFVASMHGICKLVDRELEIHDLTHLIPPFNIEAASSVLQYTVPTWPKGTVFVCVVDPGVGTERKASVALLKNGSYVVTPDNGTLTFLDKMIGVTAIREIDEVTNRYHDNEEVHIFHGRDLFAYCGAKLASGIISFEEVGPEYSVNEIVKYKTFDAEVKEGYCKATIQGFDPFGTAEISVLNKEFVNTGFKVGDLLDVTVSLEGTVMEKWVIPYERSFGYVPLNEDVLFNDLASFVSIGTNCDSFEKKHYLDRTKEYTVEICKH